MVEPEREMRNPFRNEADAFRILVMFIVAAAAVIATTLLIGAWLGVAIALVAIGAGVYSTIGWLRVGLGERDEPEPDAAGRPEIRTRAGSGPDAPGGS